MAANYPAGDQADCPRVRIAKDGIAIGGAGFSSGMIEKDSVELCPGGAEGLVNRLTVTLFVGEVDVDDDALNLTRVRP